MQEIDSSAIATVGYDAEQQILRLTYRGGETYDYLDVPPEEFDGFMSAASRGIYANKIIKPNYEYRKV
ncbi:MAG TPA: KTSC domain-containing protein [Thermoanaerobaculia bacterium]|nr:KTSC domain-containing protein [Thermoanaerobaculia bacterium]